MVFGSKDKYQKFYAEKILSFYNEVARSSLAKEPGFVLGKFSEVAQHPDFQNAINTYLKEGSTDAAVNIYNILAEYAPENELKKAILDLFYDKTIQLLGDRIPSILFDRFLRPLSCRCPIADRGEIFTQLEDMGLLVKVAPRSPYSVVVPFYVAMVEGRPDEQAIPRLKGSKSWNALNHRDSTFVGLLDDRDPRLLAALR